MRRNLALERGCPAPRNVRAAARAAALRREPVLANEVAVALNQHLAAVRTPGIFEMSDFTRKISRVDVTESGLPSDRRRPFEGCGRGAFPIRHLIVLMESRDVPGNVGRDAGQKFGEPF